MEPYFQNIECHSQERSRESHAVTIRCIEKRMVELNSKYTEYHSQERSRADDWQLQVDVATN